MNSRVCKRSTCLVLILSALFLLAGETNAQRSEDRRDRDFSVMTRNMYLGAELGDIFAAQTPQELFVEVAEAYTEMQAGLPAERIAGIADEIEDGEPVFVGLQEVALWRVGAPFDPAPAENVTYDFLQLLLDELAIRGLHYEPIAVKTNFDAEVPGVFSPSFALDIRFTDRLVVLARTDLKTSQLKIENIEAHHFSTNLIFTSPTLGTITIPRAWIGIDAQYRGKTYRFVNTHLESFSPIVTYIQAGELVQMAGETDLAMILAGDFNADAEASDPAYLLLLSAGLTDVWEATNPSDPGFTWALFLTDPTIYTVPTQRLDLILTRGSIEAASAYLTGEDPLTDRTATGLMRSDHAGVIASLILEP